MRGKSNTSQQERQPARSTNAEQNQIRQLFEALEEVLQERGKKARVRKIFNEAIVRVDLCTLALTC